MLDVYIPRFSKVVATGTDLTDNCTHSPLVLKPLWDSQASLCYGWQIHTVSLLITIKAASLLALIQVFPDYRIALTIISGISRLQMRLTDKSSTSSCSEAEIVAIKGISGIMFIAILSYDSSNSGIEQILPAWVTSATCNLFPINRWSATTGLKYTQLHAYYELMVIAPVLRTYIIFIS